MAEVSFFQLRQNDDHGDEFDDRDDVIVSFSSPNNWSLDLDEFDVYHSDVHHHLSSDDFFSHTDRNLFDRENQVNFVIDMLHQRIEQSQVITDSSLQNSNANDLDVDFGLGLRLGFSVADDNNCNDDDYLGFMLADCGDDFFISRTTIGAPSIRSSDLEYFIGGFMVHGLCSDSDVARETEIDLAIIGDRNNRANANEDFEWEEIDDGEELHTFFESEPDNDTSFLPQVPHELHQEQPDSLEWEVLLNLHNLELNPELPNDQYEMLFGQFADNDASSLCQPPASKRVVNNLLSVVITDEDIKNSNTLCAVCKDEIVIGLIAKQLPCAHRYHGDCITPWLGIRNTCPVCRHELLTDDLDYERRKAERAARDH